jgi:hypothetical protein
MAIDFVSNELPPPKNGKQIPTKLVTYTFFNAHPPFFFFFFWGGGINGEKENSIA